MNEQLTAYALDELPPEERAALEAQMNADPLLRQQAEEVKAFCLLLKEQTAQVEGEALTEPQRVKVITAFHTGRKSSRPFWRHPAFFTTALAAGLALALLMPTELLVQKRVLQEESSVPAPNETKVGRALNNDPRDGSALGRNEIKLPGPMEPQHAQEDASRQQVAAAGTPHPNQTLSSKGDTPSTLPAKPESGEKREFRSEGEEKAMAARQNSIPSSSTGDVAPMAKAKQPTPLPGAAPLPPPAPVTGPVTRSQSAMPAAPPTLGASAEMSASHPEPQSVGSAIVTDIVTEIPVRRVTGDEIPVLERSTISGTESYAMITENPFMTVTQAPLSTFSIDVDTASYAIVRRYLNLGQRPPSDAVRLEELVNYFPYTYEAPDGDHPFSVQVDIAEAPWNPAHRLARIALKGREVVQNRGRANFVFLVDVSGSMNEADKLPLVKQSLHMLVQQLHPEDRVAMVTYAGSSALVLESTPGSQKSRIVEAVDNLRSGGSTNGAGGIRLAYEEARRHFQQGGVNRVILCTDGDFNVGISSPKELEKLIVTEARSKVYLSVLGFGRGNLKDHTMETLADKGNGNYAYIDSLSEARKVLVEQMNGTLVTIAKDVKIQVEFNPGQVQSYRLLGYENRTLAKEDFNNDQKDAGEIGAGHTVTALYELVPADLKLPDGRPMVDALKYAPKSQLGSGGGTLPSPAAASAAPNPECMTVKLRYKQPDGDASVALEVPVTDERKMLAESPGDFQFAASVAGFGMLLRSSAHAGDLTWDRVRSLALTGKGEDTLGYRGEFLQLIDKARGLTE